MIAKSNPFDKSPADIPMIKFMIHSLSLEQEICTTNSTAQRLIKSNCLKQINILPLPSSNANLCQFYKDNGLSTTDYQQTEFGIVLQSSGGSWYSVIHGLKENPNSPIVPGSLVTKTDIFAFKNFDYLVVGRNDSILSSAIYSRNIVTADQAIELVRILLVNNDFFYITANNDLTDEFGYYLYRFKKLFNSFHYAWSIAVYAHGKGISEEVFEFLDSLSRRLDLICRAYDKVCFFSLKTANNITQDNQLYHLAYYVMLVTGVFDTLAHIIVNYYHLTTNSKLNITLRKKQRNSKDIFFNKLSNVNRSLYEYLTSSVVQSRINVFYPIRDSLQHRELLRGIRYSDSQNPDKNLFQLSNDATTNLMAVSSEISCIVDKIYMDPFIFISWANTALVELVNKTLMFIDWGSAKNSLSAELNEKISKSNKLYNQNLGKFLKLTGDDQPLYF